MPLLSSRSARAKLFSAARKVRADALRVAQARPGARDEVVDPRLAIGRAVEALRDLDAEPRQLQRPARLLEAPFPGGVQQQVAERPGVVAARRRSPAPTGVRTAALSSSRISSKASERSAARLICSRLTSRQERSKAGPYSIAGRIARRIDGSRSALLLQASRRVGRGEEMGGEAAAVVAVGEEVPYDLTAPAARQPAAAEPREQRRMRVLIHLGLPLRLLIEPDGQELPGERRETAVGDLADAGGAVAHLLGHLGRTVAETVAQLEQRPAAGRQARRARG